MDDDCQIPEIVSAGVSRHGTEAVSRAGDVERTEASPTRRNDNDRCAHTAHFDWRVVLLFARCSARSASTLRSRCGGDVEGSSLTRSALQHSTLDF